MIADDETLRLHYIFILIDTFRVIFLFIFFYNVAALENPKEKFNLELLINLANTAQLPV